jgi:hypothetical protein
MISKNPAPNWGHVSEKSQPRVNHLVRHADVLINLGQDA